MLCEENVDVALYWHAWKAPSHRLQRLTDAVVRAAGEGLRPVRASGPHASSVATRPIGRSPRGM